MVIVVARQRAGITLMKVLPAPEPGRPDHLHSKAVRVIFTQKRGCPTPVRRRSWTGEQL
jgi:hypothetical protein